MSFCIRCATPPCGNLGIISVSINSSSSARPVDAATCSNSTMQAEYIPGPSVGTVSIQAYAFAAGDKEKWGGTTCKGSAQASQSNIQRYNASDDKWYLIPSNIHKAQITGGFIDGTLVKMSKVFFQGKAYEAQILNGASLTTEMTVQLGADFSYTGNPVAAKIPDLEPYTLDVAGGITGAFISSISTSADYPNTPATVTYTFEFPIGGS